MKIEREKKEIREIIKDLLNNSSNVEMKEKFKNLLWNAIRIKEQKGEDILSESRWDIEYFHRLLLKILIDFLEPDSNHSRFNSFTNFYDTRGPDTQRRWSSFLDNPTWDYFVHELDYHHKDFTYSKLLQNIIFEELSINEIPLIRRTRGYYSSISNDKHPNEEPSRIPQTQNTYLSIFRDTYRLFLLTENIIKFSKHPSRKIRKKEIHSFSLAGLYPTLEHLNGAEFLEAFLEIVFQSKSMRDLIFSNNIFTENDIKNHAVLQEFYPLKFLKKFLINEVLMSQYPQEFRVDGPQLIDFDQGNWIFIPPFVSDMEKIISKNKSMILRGSTGTGKSVIARYLGYKFSNRRAVYYFDLLDFIEKDTSDILEYLERLSTNITKGSKLKEMSLFIFDNIHILHEDLLKSLSRIVPLFTCILIERTILEQKEINKKQLYNSKQEILNILHKKINYNFNFSEKKYQKSLHEGIIRQVIEDEKIADEIHSLREFSSLSTGLWFMAFFLRILKYRYNQRIKFDIKSVLHDTNKITRELFDYFQNLFHKRHANFNFKESQMGTIQEHLRLLLLIIAFFSQEEKWVNKSFIDILLESEYGPISEFKKRIQFKSERISQIIDFLVSIQEVKYRTIIDSEGITQDQYRIPHRQLASLYIKFFHNAIPDWSKFVNQIYLEAPIEFSPDIIVYDEYSPGDGGFIDPGMYRTTNLQYPLYGVYLRLMFKYEFTKYRSQKNFQKMERILTIFSRYYKERPTIQDRLFVTYEGDIPFGPERIKNHYPSNYFDIIIKSFEIDTLENISKGDEKDWDKKALRKQYPDYYIPRYSFDNSSGLNLEKNSQNYYKISDIKKSIIDLSKRGNSFVFPWIDAFLKEQNKKLNINFETSHIFTLLMNEKDNNIQESILNIMLHQDFDFCIENLDSILSLQNENLIIYLLNQFQKKISTNCLKKDFNSLITLFKTPFILLSDMIFILNLFERVNLSSIQLKVLQNIYFTQQEIFINKIEAKFLLNIILLINDKFSPRDEKSVSLMTEYALASSNLFYFDVLSSLNYANSIIIDKFDINLYEKLKLNQYSDDSDSYERSYYIDKYDRAILSAKLPLSPNRSELSSSSEKIVTIKKKIEQHNQKIKDKKKISTILKNLYDTFENVKNNLEKLKFKSNSILEKSLEKIYNHPNKNEIASNIFELLWKNRRIQGSKQVNLMGVAIPYDFIAWHDIFETFFLQFSLIEKKIRIEWLKRLIPSELDYSTYKALFLGLKRDHLIDIIPLIREKEYKNNQLPYQRTIHYYFGSHSTNYWDYEIGSQNIEELPIYLIMYIPFEELHQKLKDLLDYEEMKSKFDQNYTLKNEYRTNYVVESEHWYYYGENELSPDNITDWNSVPRPFLNVLYNYAEIMVDFIGSKKIIQIFSNLWEEYWYYPLVHYKHHPSYFLFKFFSQDLLFEIFFHMNDRNAKNALLLAYMRRYGYLGLGWYNYEINSEQWAETKRLIPIKILSKTNPKSISTTMKMILNTDWLKKTENHWEQTNQRRAQNSFDVLFFFADLSELPLQNVLDFIKRNKKVQNSFQFMDLKKFFPHYKYINQNIFERLAVFHNILEIEENNWIKIPKDLFQHSLANNPNIIVKLENLNLPKKTNVPILDTKKISTGFIQIWKLFEEDCKWWNETPHSSELKNYLTNFFENPIFYFLPDSLSLPLPEGINYKPKSSSLKPHENFSEDSDYEEWIWNKNDVFQFDNSLVEFTFNLFEEVLENETVLKKLRLIKNRKYAEYLIGEFNIGEDFNFPMRYLIEILIYLLEILVKKPEKQNFKIESLGIEFGNQLYKETSMEINLIDKIIDFGFENELLTSWFETLVTKIEVKSTEYRLFQNLILNSLYKFTDLNTLPSFLKLKGLRRLLAKIFISIHRNNEKK